MTRSWSFSGRRFEQTEIGLVQEVVASCSELSRMELAQTVCELLDWRRPSGSLKARECREFLERLDGGGVIELPGKRAGRPQGSRTQVPITAQGEPAEPVVGTVREVGPLDLRLVEGRDDQLMFRELVGRHHYLGYKVPFGAQLRYLVYVSKPERSVVGCLQFSSPAWRMAARDRWIGWDDATRRRNLQRVVNNSRFLVLPWVRVKNLASAVLSAGLRRLRVAWVERYGVDPLMVETLVDGRRFDGTCYRAANWVELGSTTGRGRMDRYKRRAGSEVKTILVYPLVRHAARRLRDS